MDFGTSRLAFTCLGWHSLLLLYDNHFQDETECRKHRADISIGMTLIPQPYYWSTLDFGGSPPLGTRAGWMALACMPFVL